MAKIVFGPIVSDARKKVGGVVFTKGHAGAVVRRKVSPIQPRTTAQRAVRANFTANAKAWSGTLDPAGRASFNSLASSLTKKDKFGQSYTETGAQLYQSTSRNLHTLGLPPLTAAPANMAVTDLGGLTLTEVTSESTPLTGPGIEITPTNFPPNTEGIEVMATAPLRAGVTFVGKGKYRLIKVLYPWPDTSPPDQADDISKAYEDKFGQLEAGMTIHVQINNINSVNGAAGKPYPAAITLA